jgi:hypothetical protein
MKHSTLIGRRVYIKDENNPYYDEWGTVVYVDEYYHVAIADGTVSIFSFDRSQLYVPHNIKDVKNRGRN